MSSVDLTLHTTAQAQIDAVASALPQIKTERLTLRASRLSDWAMLEPIWTTDRAKHIGGPFSVEDAWLDFSQLCASWMLRGFGGLTITLTETSDVLGMVLLGREYKDPEPELGWLLTEEAEGHGYATEAALVLRDEGLRLFGAGGFVSYVEDNNARSIAPAERIGGVADTARHPIASEVLVYRHGLKGGTA